MRITISFECDDGMDAAISILKSNLERLQKMRLGERLRVLEYHVNEDLEYVASRGCGSMEVEE